MPTLHIISHTHWDREWYLTFQQFRLKLVHLIDNLLDILVQEPRFRTFLLDGQTIILEDYLQIRPEKEPQLRQYIENGRIVIGPWYTSPDLFLVSPEALIRNLLEGERVAHRFGPTMNIGYMPDLFGHPGQMPQILRGFGLDAAVLWRGLADEPAECWWEAPDGTRIFLAYLRDCYNNGAALSVAHPEQFTLELGRVRDSLAAHSAVDEWLIMLGNDHMEPSPYTAAALSYAHDHLPETVQHSSLADYVAAVRPTLTEREIPVIQGELRACQRSPLLPGVLSTRLWLKQRNHTVQTLLEQWAEPFTLLADQLTADWPNPPHGRVQNPTPLLRQAWRLLLQNHPHDSICGCSIDQVHEEMKPRFDQAEQIGEELTQQSLSTIATAVDTQLADALAAVVVFNPSSSPRTDVVQVNINLGQEVADFCLVDAEGTVVAHQSVDAAQAELFNMVLDRPALRGVLAHVHDGVAAGFSVQTMALERHGAQVTARVTVKAHGKPDRAAWEKILAQSQPYLNDQTITSFHVVVRQQAASAVTFVAADVAAHGWRTYWVKAIEPPAAELPAMSRLAEALLPATLWLAETRLGQQLLARLTPHDENKPPFRLENRFFVVEANTADGTLTITDKQTQVVYRGLNRFVDGGDRGDEYNYDPPEQDSEQTAVLKTIKIFRGEVCPALEIVYELTVPATLDDDRTGRAAQMVTMPIVSRITLPRAVARIDVATTIDNNAQDHRLRVHFAAPFAVEQAHYDGHFEVVERPLALPVDTAGWVEQPRPEQPQRAFTSISNGRVGLTVANRGLPEVEVVQTAAGSAIALTLLRCVGWLSRDDLRTRQGHAGPATETAAAQMLGRWCFVYAIIPHAGDWTNVYQEAYAFATPMRAVLEPISMGTLPSRGSFLQHTPAEFVITAVKEAAAGEGWIVRGYNISAEPLTVTLAPQRPFAEVMRVNLAETELERLSPTAEGVVSFPVRGREIVTVLFR